MKNKAGAGAEMRMPSSGAGAHPPSSTMELYRSALLLVGVAAAASVGVVLQGEDHHRSASYGVVPPDTRIEIPADPVVPEGMIHVPVGVANISHDDFWNSFR
jgi:hypothetical protein